MPTPKMLSAFAASVGVRAPAGASRQAAPSRLRAGLLLSATVIAGCWLVGAAPSVLIAQTASAAGSAAALRLAVGGLCTVAGLAFLVLAGLGTRRRAVAAEVTYEHLTAGLVALLQARYVRGDLTLAEYEAGLGRVLPPAERLTGARGPLRLTLPPDTARRAVAGTGGALLLAAGLAVLVLGGAPAGALVSANAVHPAAMSAPVPGDGCPSWLPPGHRRKCWQRQQAASLASSAGPQLGPTSLLSAPLRGS